MTRERRSTASFEEIRATMDALGTTSPPSRGLRTALRSGRLTGVV